MGYLCTIWMNKCWHHLPLCGCNLVVRQLNRFLTTPKLLQLLEDDSNTIESTLVSGSEDHCSAMEFTLVFDLVPQEWICWGVTFQAAFFISIVGSLVSGAGSDGILFPCDLWRSNNYHQLTIRIGPLPLSGLMIYTFGSQCFNSMTNSLLLWLSWILLWPSRWSWSNTKLPSVMSRAFPPAWETDFSELSFILSNAHLFAARMNSSCWLIQAHLLCKKLSL